MLTRTVLLNLEDKTLRMVLCGSLEACPAEGVGQKSLARDSYRVHLEREGEGPQGKPPLP